MSRTNYVSSKIREAFSEVDSYVIGLAKIHGNTELIIEKDKDTFTTLTVGSLLGHTMTHYGVADKKHCIFMFPKGKTLKEMKDDPMAFNDFYNKIK